MNNPILLIIQREFLSRVRKKTFLLVTILGPLIFAALLIVPGILASMPEDDKNIIVLDEAALIIPEEGRGEYQLEYLDPRENDLATAKEFFAESSKQSSKESFKESFKEPSAGSIKESFKGSS